MTEAPAIHPAIEPLAWLLGTWRGEGQGSYPTISDFAYREEVRFDHIGKPFVTYAQRTWSLEDGAPMHSETGYWRMTESGSIEIVLAHSFGLTEISEGRVEGQRITVASKALTGSSTAKDVEGVSRVYGGREGSLEYTVEMAFGGNALQYHLSAELRRVDTSAA